jgi:hypothetical protein
MDLSPESVVAREEEWLNNNNPALIRSTNNFRNSPFALYIVRRNQRLSEQPIRTQNTNILRNVRKFTIKFRIYVIFKK